MNLLPKIPVLAMFLLTWTLATCIVTIVDGFSLATPSFASPNSRLKSPYSVSSRVLFAGNSDENQPPEENPAANSSDEASSVVDDANGEAPVPPETSLTEAASGMDILNSPQFLNRKRDVLLNDLQTIQNDIFLAKEQLKQNKNEWGPQFADLAKEYEMIQQRMNVQSNANNDVATSQVVRSMLAVLDNFDRAFGQVTAAAENEIAIENEYKLVYGDVLDIFKKLGVEEVPTVGTEFDYEIHQAVMQKPSADYEEGIVCEELQKGFRINNTLIRAAMVAVAM
jgi:molecular chaperone GrpE